MADQQSSTFTKSAVTGLSAMLLFLGGVLARHYITPIQGQEQSRENKESKEAPQETVKLPLPPVIHYDPPLKLPESVITECGRAVAIQGVCAGKITWFTGSVGAAQIIPSGNTVWFVSVDPGEYVVGGTTVINGEAIKPESTKVKVLKRDYSKPSKEPPSDQTPPPLMKTEAPKPAPAPPGPVYVTIIKDAGDPLSVLDSSELSDSIKSMGCILNPINSGSSEAEVFDKIALQAGLPALILARRTNEGYQVILQQGSQGPVPALLLGKTATEIAAQVRKGLK